MYRDAVRRDLAHLNDPVTLASSPLAATSLIERRLREAGVQFTSLDRGREVQRLLKDAMIALRQGEAGAQATDASRAYAALHMHFMQNLSYTAVARQLGVSNATFYRLIAIAIDALTAILHTWIERADVQPTIAITRPRLLPLPSPIRFAGRRAELAKLRERLSTPARCCGPRVVTITGIGGSGKTELIKQIVHERWVDAQYPDGVCWATAGRTPDVTVLLQRWGRVLGIPDSLLRRGSSETELAQLVHGIAVGRRVLFVIDDVWSARDALAMRVGGSDCAFVCTARSTDIALALGDTDPVVLGELLPEDSQALLRSYAAQAVAAHTELSAALITQLAGLPLAIALAGQYLQQASFTGQPRRVTQAFERLNQSLFRMSLVDRGVALDGGDPAQRSLAAVMGQTVDALSDDARAALAQLAVFPPKPDTVSEQMMTDLGISQEALDMLVNFGLLEPTSNGRYALQRTIAEFAQAHLCAPPDWARMIAQLARRVETDVQNAGSDFSKEFDTAAYIHATRCALTHGHESDGIRLIRHLAQALNARGLASTAEELLAAALATPLCKTSPEPRTSLLIEHSRAALLLRRRDVARASVHEAMDIAARTGDRLLLSKAADVAAHVNIACEDFDAAHFCAQQALQAALACNDVDRIAACQATLSVCLAALGRHHDAMRNAVQGRSRLIAPAASVGGNGQPDMRQVRVQSELAHADLLRAQVHYAAGQIELALTTARETSATARSAGLIAAHIEALGYLAWLHRFRGHMAEARALLAEADHLIVLRSQDWPEAVPVHVARAELALCGGDFDEATRAAERAVAVSLRHQHEALFGCSAVLATLARVELTHAENLDDGQAVLLRTSAKESLRRALAFADRNIDRIAPLCELARLAARTGDVEHVELHLKEAHTRVGLLGVFDRPVLSMLVTHATADSLRMIGRHEDALRYAREALRYATRVNSPEYIGHAHLVMAQVIMQHSPADWRRVLSHATQAFDAYSKAGHHRVGKAESLCRYITLSELGAPQE